MRLTKFVLLSILCLLVISEAKKAKKIDDKKTFLMKSDPNRLNANSKYLDSMFRQNDPNHNGTIDQDEIPVFIGFFQQQCPDCEFNPAPQELMEKYDADKSGGIDINEFVDMHYDILAGYGME